MSNSVKFFIVILLIFASLAQPLFLTSVCTWCAESSSDLYNYIKSVSENHKDRIIILMLCGFGALLGPLFGPKGVGDRSAIPFLRTLFPNWSDLTYHRVNILITIMVGMALAYTIMCPSTNVNAIASGTCWSATLSNISNLKYAPNSIGIHLTSERSTPDMKSTQSDYWHS
jgi:hypothetical protein